MASRRPRGESIAQRGRERVEQQRDVGRLGRECAEERQPELLVSS